MEKDRLHIVIKSGDADAWLAPINSLGQADVNWKDELSVAAALRRIADEFESGMSYQFFHSSEEATR